MKKIITGLFTLLLIISCSHANKTYAQGVKLSSFPLATALDSNVSVVGVWDSVGYKIDKRYPTRLFESYLFPLLTLNQVLFNGNTSAYSISITDYGSNYTNI